MRGSLQPTPDGLRIVEPKTASSRRGVVLSATAVEALRRHRIRQAAERLRLGAAWDDHDLVFANEVGKPIDGRNLVRRGFEPLLARAALPRVRFHDLRHTAATLLLGQARGTAICAAVLESLPVAEYTALQVKQAVVGNGHAKKEQVQEMVRRLLGLPGNPSPDAADALACAICHAHGGQGLGSIATAGYRVRKGRLI